MTLPVVTRSLPLGSGWLTPKDSVEMSGDGCEAHNAIDPVLCCADNNNNNNQNGYPREESRRRYSYGGQYYSYGQGPYAQAAYYEGSVSALCSFIDRAIAGLTRLITLAIWGPATCRAGRACCSASMQPCCWPWHLCWLLLVLAL